MESLIFEGVCVLNFVCLFCVEMYVLPFVGLYCTRYTRYRSKQNFVKEEPAAIAQADQG